MQDALGHAAAEQEASRLRLQRQGLDLQQAQQDLQRAQQELQRAQRQQVQPWSFVVSQSRMDEQVYDSSYTEQNEQAGL